MTYDAKEVSTYGGAPIECYRFRIGALDYRLTSGDTAISIDEGAGTYEYLPGPLMRDRVEFSGEDYTSTVTVEIEASHAVAQLFVPYTPTEPLALTIFRTHYGEAEVVVAFSGTVASAEFDGGVAKLTCLRTAGLLKRRVPRPSYQSTCNHPLYGPRCGVNPATYKVAATVAEISGASLRATNFGAHPDGYLSNGWVELASGERRFIVNHIGEWVTLMSPFFGLALATSIDAYPGCDRTEAVCSAKYSNLVHHFGMPRIPQRNIHEKGLG